MFSKIHGPSSNTLCQSPRHENWRMNRFSSMALNLTSFAKLQAHFILAKNAAWLNVFMECTLARSVQRASAFYSSVSSSSTMPWSSSLRISRCLSNSSKSRSIYSPSRLHSQTGTRHLPYLFKAEKQTQGLPFSQPESRKRTASLHKLERDDKNP